MCDAFTHGKVLRIEMLSNSKLRKNTFNMKAVQYGVGEDFSSNERHFNRIRRL